MILEKVEHELLDIARAHHVHFDVAPEVTFRETDHVKVGFEVRLWATHARGARDAWVFEVSGLGGRPPADRGVGGAV